MKKKTRNKKIIIYDLIIVILVISLIAVVYNIFTYYRDNAKSQNKIGNLKALVATQDSSEINNCEQKSEDTDEGKESEIQEKKYEKLLEKNSDFVGWITIDGTVIDYPVMQNINDNEYYLHRDFNKDYDYSGLIFADIRCNIKTPTANTILYGHNMKSGTMFADLLKYKDKTHYDNHNIVKFDTIYEDRTYQVFAAFYTDINNENNYKYYDFIDAVDETQYEDAMSSIKAMSYYKEDFPQYGDEILTLSTCGNDYESSRFVVMAKRIKDK